MLRASRPLLGPIRAVTARGIHASPAAFGMRAAALPISRAAASQSCPTHARPQRRTPLSLASPTPPSKLLLAAYATSSRPPVKPKIDREHEKELAKQKLEPRPGEVTVESSRRHVFEPYEKPHEEPPVMNSVKADVDAIQEALALTAVPPKWYALGLGGTIPYFITSLSTVYFEWTLRHTYLNSFMVSHETAHRWLQIMEPIQLSYGAAIISFLGIYHLGMEYMEKETTPSPDRTRFRYAMGILAPAMAWPTLYLPIHFALTGQFLAFTLLYMADTRATKLGWAPPWYGTYRFVLTFVVGSAILICLVFRAKIDDAGKNMRERLQTGMHQRGATEQEYTEKWAELEKEEKEKLKKEHEEEEKKKNAEKEDGDGKNDENKDNETEDMNGDKNEDSGKDDDNSKGDETKDAVDENTSSKKKSAKGDEKSNGNGGKGGK